MRQLFIRLFVSLTAAFAVSAGVLTQSAGADPTRVWCGGWWNHGELSYRACVEHTIGGSVVVHRTQVKNVQPHAITINVAVRRGIDGVYTSCTTRSVTVPPNGGTASNSCNSRHVVGSAYSTVGRIAGAISWAASPYVEL